MSVDLNLPLSTLRDAAIAVSSRILEVRDRQEEQQRAIDFARQAEAHYANLVADMEAQLHSYETAIALLALPNDDNPTR